MSDQRARVLVHGTSLVIGTAGASFQAPEDIGVLLLGDSGSGKSDLALRLIANGACLIADDQTVLFVRSEGNRGRLFAAAPERTRGLLEVRGVGIVEVAAADEAPLLLVVQLRVSGISRMPEPEIYVPPSPLQVAAAPALIALNAFEASTPAKIAAAAAMAAKGRFGGSSGAAGAP
jgi:hypothetical protein